MDGSISLGSVIAKNITQIKSLRDGWLYYRTYVLRFQEGRKSFQVFPGIFRISLAMCFLCEHCHLEKDSVYQ